MVYQSARDLDEHYWIFSWIFLLKIGFGDVPQNCCSCICGTFAEIMIWTVISVDSSIFFGTLVCIISIHPDEDVWTLPLLKGRCLHPVPFEKTAQLFLEVGFPVLLGLKCVNANVNAVAWQSETSLYLQQQSSSETPAQLGRTDIYFLCVQLLPIRTA